MKEEVQRSGTKRLEEKSRGQISEVRSHRRINFDIRRVSPHKLCRTARIPKRAFQCGPPRLGARDSGRSSIQPKISKENIIMKSITAILATTFLLLSPVAFDQAQGTPTLAASQTTTAPAGAGKRTDVYHVHFT